MQKQQAHTEQPLHWSSVTNYTIDRRLWHHTKPPWQHPTPAVCFERGEANLCPAIVPPPSGQLTSYQQDL